MKAKRETGLATNSCYYASKLYAMTKFNSEYSFVAYAPHLKHLTNSSAFFSLALCETQLVNNNP